MKTNHVALPAGTYYIGDLCYVVGRENHDAWMDFLKPFFTLTEPNDCAGGEVSYRGKQGFMAYTKYGDGTYHDGLYEYPVDAGSIGALPIDVLDVPVAEAETCGRIVTFDRPFTCHRDSNGVFTFGNVVTIDTDPEPVEDDYDYSDEDE